MEASAARVAAIRGAAGAESGAGQGGRAADAGEQRDGLLQSGRQVAVGVDQLGDPLGHPAQGAVGRRAALDERDLDGAAQPLEVADEVVGLDGRPCGRPRPGR
jgi:hypothetical protein